MSRIGDGNSERFNRS